ncbi:hypothetical protein B0H10DRAFT_2045278 [Mycena sp. CBHHK59/15]|nr:hypothetical protein B0H10DRAFT_2045278 [Mycena sp. CBHHK59/15]
MPPGGLASLLVILELDCQEFSYCPMTCRNITCLSWPARETGTAWPLPHLQSLKPGMTTPEVALFGDGHYRRVIYGVGPYMQITRSRCSWLVSCRAGPGAILGAWTRREVRYGGRATDGKS